MKLLIIIDFILPALAIYELGWALYYAKIMTVRMEANKQDLEERNLLYLLAEDKQLLAFAGRVIVVMLIVANFLLFTWSLSRMLDGFAGYATGWITVTAGIFHLIMYLTARLICAIYYGSKLQFLKKIFKR